MISRPKCVWWRKPPALKAKPFTICRAALIPTSLRRAAGGRPVWSALPAGMGINQSKTPGDSRCFLCISAGRSRLCPSSLDTDHRQRQYYQRNATTFHLSSDFHVVATEENSTPQTGTASVLRPAILAGKLRSTKSHRLRGQRRCKDCAVSRGPRKRRAASLPLVAGRAEATTLITTAAYSICHVVSASKSTCGYRVYIRFATIAPAPSSRRRGSPARRFSGR